MKSRSLRLLAFSLLLLVSANPRPVSEAPIVTPSATPVQSWEPMRRLLDEEAYRTAVWYAEASKEPATKAASRRIERVVYGSGACGGDLPPCSVMQCESHGNLVAQNPRSTASGKWQILDSTWARYGGYERAMYAPEEVQDARAREIYRNGAGRSAWVC